MQGKRQHATSAFLKEALDRGAEQFKWRERADAHPKRIGSKVRGVGVSLSCYVGGIDRVRRVLVIKPDGRIAIHSGIGNLGTESVIDVHRVAAEVLGVPWEKCDISWGSSLKNLPWTCISGRQPDDARDDAGGACRGDGRQEEAPGHRREKSRRQARTSTRSPTSACFERAAAPGMTFAQAAQRAIELGGIYDGHEAPEDVNR